MSWKFKDVLLPPIEVYIYNMCVFPHDLVDAAFEIMRVTRWGACLFFPKENGNITGITSIVAIHQGDSFRTSPAIVGKHDGLTNCCRSLHQFDLITDIPGS